MSEKSEKSTAITKNLEDKARILVRKSSSSTVKSLIIMKRNGELEEEQESTAPSEQSALRHLNFLIRGHLSN
jgi:hypothetical protein